MISSKTDSRSGSASYVFGALWTSGAGIFGLLASLVIVIISARVLEKSALGAYFLSMSVILLTVTLGDIGIRTAAIRFVSVLKSRKKQLTLSRYFLRLNVLISIATCAILYCVLPYAVAYWDSDAFERIAWYTVPSAFIMSNFQLAYSVLAGNKHFKLMSMSLVVTEFVRLALSVILLLSGFGVSGLLIAFFISRCVGLSVIMLKFPQICGVILKSKNALEIINFSGWMWGTSVVSVFNAKLIDFFLTTYLGTATLAIYSTASQVPSLLQRLFEFVKPVILGHASSRHSDRNKSFGFTCRMIASVLSLGAIALIALSEPLVIFIFSERYSESIPIMQLLCAWFAITTTNYYLVLSLIGLGETKSTFFLALVQLVVVASLGAQLIPDEGGLGAALSLTGMSLIATPIACVLYFRKNLNLGFSLYTSCLRSQVPLLLFTFVVIFNVYNPVQTVLLGTAAVGILIIARAIKIEEVVYFFDRILQRRGLGR